MSDVHAKALAAMDAGWYVIPNHGGWVLCHEASAVSNGTELFRACELTYQDPKTALAAAYDALFPGQGPRYVVTKRITEPIPVQCDRCGSTTAGLATIGDHQTGIEYVCADGCSNSEEET